MFRLCNGKCYIVVDSMTVQNHGMIVQRYGCADYSWSHIDYISFNKIKISHRRILNYY